MNDVPPALPATVDPLKRAWSVQMDASHIGFDWPEVSGVLAKVHEECEEVEEALAAGDASHARRELGDLLFAAVNLARFLHADPGTELDLSTQRFSERFSLLQADVKASGRVIRECTLAELDEVWERIKMR